MPSLLFFYTPLGTSIIRNLDYRIAGNFHGQADPEENFTYEKALPKRMQYSAALK